MRDNPSLFLIPNILGESDFNRVFPDFNREVLSNIRYFIVEDVRSAKRLLKQSAYPIDFNDANFEILDKHTDVLDVKNMLQPIEDGHHIGLISEAGLPCIADPGSEIVILAHSKGVRVVPLIGPSSIIMALISSGMNGQNFAFNGYLPIKEPSRTKKIKELEKNALLGNQTQIFIETPYRNSSLIKSLVSHCKNETLLCIACNISTKLEYIKTRSIKDWKKNLPEINKQPAVFLLSAQ